jgi:uncharacterized phiE125 gp8 family phage protein
VATAATLQPVTVYDVKTYLREINDEDDALIFDWINAATDELQKATGRAFINTTFDDVYDQWPITENSFAVCHRVPLSTVSSIKYIDSNGTQQTWSSSYYDVDTTSEPGRIGLAYGATIPTIRLEDNSVVIRYVAGYGATPATVPAAAKHYIYMWIAAAHCRRPAMEEEIRHMRSIINTLSYGLSYGG